MPNQTSHSHFIIPQVPNGDQAPVDSTGEASASTDRWAWHRILRYLREVSSSERVANASLLDVIVSVKPIRWLLVSPPECRIRLSSNFSALLRNHLKMWKSWIFQSSVASPKLNRHVRLWLIVGKRSEATIPLAMSKSERLICFFTRNHNARVMTIRLLIRTFNIHQKMCRIWKIHTLIPSKGWTSLFNRVAK